MNLPLPALNGGHEHKRKATFVDLHNISVHTSTYRRNLVPTFVDRGMSRGQCGGSLTAVNLSFLDRSRHFSFK
jgi:hypothetical protein